MISTGREKTSDGRWAISFSFRTFDKDGLLIITSGAFAKLDAFFAAELVDGGIFIMIRTSLGKQIQSRKLASGWFKKIIISQRYTFNQSGHGGTNVFPHFQNSSKKLFHIDSE